jgi:hypothetical protein
MEKIKGKYVIDKPLLLSPLACKPCRNSSTPIATEAVAGCQHRLH